MTIRFALCTALTTAALVAGGTAAAAAGRFAAGPILVPFDIEESAITDVVLADFDSGGAGSADLLVTFGATTSTGGIEQGSYDRLYRNFDGGFTATGDPLNQIAPSAHVAAAAADFDLDGRLDAIVAGGSLNGTPQPTVVLRGQMPSAPLLLAPGGNVGAVVASTDVAAADIDADGDSDVAIARANGTVDVLRNDSAPGAFAFAPLTTLTVSSIRAGRLAFGRFGGDALPDLAVLRPAAAPGEMPGLLIWINAGGTTPFANPDFARLSAPIDLAVADLDGDAWDDLVVASQSVTTTANGPESSSRLVYRRPLYDIDPFRFPAVQHTAVAIGDFDDNGRPDIVFGQSPCQPGVPLCGGRETSTLSVWLQTATGFEHNPQCIGRHQNGPVAIATARIAFPVLPDFVAAGADPPAGAANGFAHWRNNADAIASLCCFAQTAALWGEGAGAPVALLAAKAASAIRAVAALDLDAYAGVRDDLMSDALNGTRLRGRYDQFNTELVAMLRADPTLWSDAAAVLTAWSGPLRALLDGDGASALVTQSMLDSVDAFLNRISISGSPALAQAVAAERALLPPFAQLVGLDMNQFRALALPPDTVLADGFE